MLKQLLKTVTTYCSNQKSLYQLVVDQDKLITQQQSLNAAQQEAMAALVAKTDADRNSDLQVIAALLLVSGGTVKVGKDLADAVLDYPGPLNVDAQRLEDGGILFSLVMAEPALKQNGSEGDIL
jgi:hypothetical protein